MQTKLRYQARMHAISNKPREIKSCKFSQKFYFIFYFYLIKEINSITSNMESNMNTCKVFSRKHKGAQQTGS
jgi:hypothetical protein